MTTLRLGLLAGLALLATALVMWPSTALMQAAAPTPTTATSGQSVPSFAPSFSVGGLVAQDRTFELADLQALPQMTLPVVYGAAGKIESASYSGPRLLDVIQAAGGPSLPAGQECSAAALRARHGRRRLSVGRLLG